MPSLLYWDSEGWRGFKEKSVFMSLFWSIIKEESFEILVDPKNSMPGKAVIKKIFGLSGKFISDMEEHVFIGWDFRFNIINMRMPTKFVINIKF